MSQRDFRVRFLFYFCNNNVHEKEEEKMKETS